MKKYFQYNYQIVLQLGYAPLKGQVHMQSSLSGKMGIILEFTTGIIYELYARVQNVEINPLIDMLFIKKAAISAAFMIINRNTSGSHTDEDECAPHDLL